MEVTATVTLLSSIPGKLTDEQAQGLYAWAYGRNVLQIGGYCGKGTVVLAKAALKVYLLDDFSSYLGGRDAVASEIMSTVERAGANDKVSLLFYSAPELIPELPAFDMVYVDADWADQEAATSWATLNLPEKGRLVFHAAKDIRQITF